MMLFSIAVFPQSINYTVSQENITNPERGFYHYSQGVSTGTFRALTTSQLVSWKNTDKVTLVWRCYYLNAYRGSTIPQSFLNKITTDMNTVRNSNTGIKLIIRFAYSEDSNDATKSRMLGHITQLTPIMTANQDVISSIEAGFIGAWGEWYYSNNFGTDDLTTNQYNKRREIANKIQLMCPSREVAYRTPEIIRKNNITNNTRVGFHNDCLFSDSTDYGTMYGTADYAFIEALSVNTVTGGETCSLSSYSTCSNALAKLAQMHWNYLNMDYNTTVLNSWKTNGCYNQIANRLGYRFELVNSTVSNNTLTINIKNTGFGNLFNERKAYLVFSNIATGQEYSFLLSTNPELWRSGTTTTVSQSLALGVPTGTYKLYLNLPDKDLSDKPVYSIQCANVGTWIPAKGFNDLKQTVQITGGTAKQVNCTTTVYDFATGTNLKKSLEEVSSKKIYIVKYNCDGVIELKKVYKN